MPATARLRCLSYYLEKNFFSYTTERKRDFLFRKDDAHSKPVFYVVSEREPHKYDQAWSVESRNYAPALKQEEKLSFLLRANPIRSRKNAEGKQERHDVVMEARKKLQEQNIPKEEWSPLADIVQDECSSWLASRAEHLGFEPLHIRTDGYQQHRYYKRGAKKEIAISTVELSGVLTVRDVSLFTDAMFKGVGHSKCFGCGLMLIKRV